jgi:hypothetical protein
MINIPPKAPIQVFDSSLNFIGEVDTYESLTHQRGWNKPGDWSVAINYNIFDDSKTLRYSDLFQIGGYITIANDGYRCGIINTIEKPIDQDGKQSQIIKISGQEPTCIFNRRMLDVPAGQDTYSLNAPAETIIKTVISDQCGPTALNVKRKFPLLSIATTQGRGLSYLISNAYTNVSDELNACSIATTLGYFIYLDRANKQLVLDCALGNNLVAGQPGNAIFSTDYDTLLSADLTTTIEQYKNLATVTGKGVGSARTVIDVYNGTEPSGFDRYETYVNANDKTTTPDLTLKGQAQLGTYKYTSTLEGAVLAKSPLIYKINYNLGDYVTIKAYDYSLNKQITMVEESWANLDYSIKPTFDKAPITLTSQVAVFSANMGSQVSKLGVSPTYTEPVWQSYPSGTYVFPSGNQNVAAGVLPIGATTTAPTFGNGTVKIAYWRDHGKTIDIRFDIFQTTSAGTAAGNGDYFLPLPLGKLFDTTMLTLSSGNFSGSMLGGVPFCSDTGALVDSGTINFRAKNNGATTAYMSGIFHLVEQTSGFAAYLWNSTSSAASPAGAGNLTISGIITGIPVQ